MDITMILGSRWYKRGEPMPHTVMDVRRDTSIAGGVLIELAEPDLGPFKPRPKRYIGGLELLQGMRSSPIVMQCYRRAVQTE